MNSQKNKTKTEVLMEQCDKETEIKKSHENIFAQMWTKVQFLKKYLALMELKTFLVSKIL